MKRKPDLLWVLVIIFGLGVVTTGYTQSLWERQASTPAQVTQQPEDSPGIAWNAVPRVLPPS
ncbi:hypothetical protein ROB62_000607 [Pseudomonas aeruginosa]|nr:hypothetical protein [Pseudomonas aeruginosa]